MCEGTQTLRGDNFCHIHLDIAPSRCLIWSAVVTRTLQSYVLCGRAVHVRKPIRTAAKWNAQNCVQSYAPSKTESNRFTHVAVRVNGMMVAMYESMNTQQRSEHVARVYIANLLVECSDKARRCLSVNDDLAPYLSTHKAIEQYHLALACLKPSEAPTKG